MTKGDPLFSEDMRVLKEIAERVVLADPSLISIKEMDVRRADALRAACKPGLNGDERLRLQVIVELTTVYIDIVRSQVNLLVDYHEIKKGYEE